MRKPLIALTALLALAIVAPLAAGAPDELGPDARFCGRFHDQGLEIRVYSKNMACRRAMRIQKEYWLGPRRRKVIVNGGAGAAGYILLKRFPGFKCSSGAGAGGCTKGDASALYANG